MDNKVAKHSNLHVTGQAISSGVQLWLNAQLSAATKDSYSRHAERLVRITGKLPEECTLEDLQRFQEVLRDPPQELIGHRRMFKTTPSPSSCQAGVHAVQSLFAFLHRAGVIQHNPALLIRTKSIITKKRVNTPSVTDFVTQCSKMAQNASMRPKVRTAGFAVLVLATTGLRASEAGNARMSDIFVRDGRAWLNVLGKGSKIGEVVLPEFLLEIRKAISADDSNSEWLVPEKSRSSGARLVIWRMVKRAAKSAGIKPDDMHPHLLRHYHATALLNAGVTLVETRDNLRHGNIAVTSQYLHSDDDNRHDAISSALNHLAELQQNTLQLVK